MVGRSPARLLAPLALTAALVALVVIVAASMTGGEGASEPSSRTAERRTTTAPRPRSRAYRVEPGDFLSRIAAKTGVSVDRLRELNPTIDPNNLRVGQRL